MANTTSSKVKTTIELNGKLYDARTGKIISDTVPSASVAAQNTSAQPLTTAVTSTPPIVAKPKKTTGMVVDGFVRGARHHSTARTQPKHQKATLQKSQTLMRPAVKKPQAASKVAAQSPIPAKKLQFKKKDAGREARAATIPKSSAIRRFKAPTQPATLVKKQAVVPVASQASTVKPQRTTVAHATPAAQRANQLAATTEAHVKQSVDAIEASLRNATSHLQHFDESLMKRSFFSRFGFFKSRAANLATLSVAGLLLVGFFAYQNAPNIEMRVAAAQSGVSAQMPGYKPTGFSASRGVKAEPGKVTVAFRSNTNDKEFTVTQQSSNWSSEALLANHVLASKQPYQTYQNEGKTVFIYDNSNATWVNGGIWYQVNGDASLTSDQLLRLANSF